MFEEAQLYSPVTQSDDGKVEVHLGKDHPGFNDPDYRARRNEIAAAAMVWEPGQPVPRVAYNEEENAIWRRVSAELHDKHERYADRVFHSTQYVRHPSEPLYTPEPDVIHEVIGHGNMLASPRFAALKQAAGEAARRVETDDAL